MCSLRSPSLACMRRSSHARRQCSSLQSERQLVVRSRPSRYAILEPQVLEAERRIVAFLLPRGPGVSCSRSPLHVNIPCSYQRFQGLSQQVNIAYCCEPWRRSVQLCRSCGAVFDLDQARTCIVGCCGSRRPQRKKLEARAFLRLAVQARPFPSRHQRSSRPRS